MLFIQTYSDVTNVKASRNPLHRGIIIVINSPTKKLNSDYAQSQSSTSRDNHCYKKRKNDPRNFNDFGRNPLHRGIIIVISNVKMSYTKSLEGCRNPLHRGIIIVMLMSLE